MAKDQKPGPTQFNFESFMTAAVYNVTLQEAYVAFKKAKSLKAKGQSLDDIRKGLAALANDELRLANGAEFATFIKDKAQFPDARLSEFVDDMAVLAQKLNHGGIAM